jgi:hypothetical protein
MPEDQTSLPPLPGNVHGGEAHCARGTGTPRPQVGSDGGSMSAVWVPQPPAPRPAHGHTFSRWSASRALNTH